MTEQQIETTIEAIRRRMAAMSLRETASCKAKRMALEVRRLERELSTKQHTFS